MAGYFNLLFESKLDAQDGNPTMKKKSLAKLIELKESYDLCDIWRVRNMKSRPFQKMTVSEVKDFGNSIAP